MRGKLEGESLNWKVITALTFNLACVFKLSCCCSSFTLERINGFGNGKQHHTKLARSMCGEKLRCVSPHVPYATITRYAKLVRAKGKFEIVTEFALWQEAGASSG